MTQTDITEREVVPKERQGRGPTKLFPMTEFEAILPLPKGILEYSVNGEIQRRTLLDKLNLSQASSRTRQLVTDSVKYGLISGSHSAPTLTITDDGRVALDSDRSPQASKKMQFDLAIARFDSFHSTYGKLKERRLPDEAVLKDELGRAGIPDGDCQKAMEIFTANLRYVGLVESINGNDQVRSIDQIVEQLQTADLGGEPHSEMPSASSMPSGPSSPQAPVVAKVTANEPSVHIDIQIHIDSSATLEQIDQIFSSMARHLYGREG